MFLPSLFGDCCTSVVSLGKEGIPTKFTISDSCPQDLYYLDYIKVTAWREKGESTSKSIDLVGSDAKLSNDKFTLYQGITDYVFPDMYSIDQSTGQFSFLIYFLIL